jgi:hypothetical protein
MNVPFNTAPDRGACRGEPPGRAKARKYIAQVKRYLREHIWTTPDFQQP